MSRYKLIIKDYTAILIDILLSTFVALLPVFILKFIFINEFQKLFPKSEISIFEQFNYQVLIASVLVLGFVIFKVFRSLKSGSPGEKMMNLD